MFVFLFVFKVTLTPQSSAYRARKGFVLSVLAKPGQARCISTKSIIYFCNKPITLGLLEVSVSNHSTANTNFICASGVVEDHNAGYIQRAPELPAATHRVHGAHIPHPQSQLTFQHNRANAGTLALLVYVSSW